MFPGQKTADEKAEPEDDEDCCRCQREILHEQVFHPSMSTNTVMVNCFAKQNKVIVREYLGSRVH